MTPAVAQQNVTQKVNDFYAELPFNMYQRPADVAALIRRGNPLKNSYPALDALLRQPANRSILEVGCGIGWFTNAVAHHYGAAVDAVDLCATALDFAGEVSRMLGTDARVAFHRADLFNLPATPGLSPGRRFRVVNSLGVLHHTYDCQKALAGILDYVDDRGFLHLGLYHHYGRRPFLNLFKGASEEEAFRIYRGLYPPTFSDETLLRSWFRDQVLHPHETQHTVREVYGWLTAAGFECLGTSINGFEPVKDWSTIFDQETRLDEVSYQKNVVERIYYPGFFVVLARRGATRTRGGATV